MQAKCRSILDRGGQGIEPGTGPLFCSAGSPSNLSTIFRERTLLTRGRLFLGCLEPFCITKFDVGLDFFLDTGVWFLADSRVHWHGPPHCRESLQAGARLDASTVAGRGGGEGECQLSTHVSNRDLNSDPH
jgi:hypothetical protein